MAFNFSQIIKMEITEAKQIGNCGKCHIRILITGGQWQRQKDKIQMINVLIFHVLWVLSKHNKYTIDKIQMMPLRENKYYFVLVK